MWISATENQGSHATKLGASPTEIIETLDLTNKNDRKTWIQPTKSAIRNIQNWRCDFQQKLEKELGCPKRSSKNLHFNNRTGEIRQKIIGRYGDMMRYE